MLIRRVCGRFHTSGKLAAGEGICQAPLLTASAADKIALWWPNQMGQQALYNVTITFTPSGAGAVRELRHCFGTVYHRFSSPYVTTTL